MIWLGALFLGYALASLAWAPEINALAIANLVGLAGAFWLGLQGIRLWREVMWAAIAIGIVYLIWPIVNPNYMGCFLALGIAVGLYIRNPMVVLIVPPLVATQSRGAIIASTATIAITFARRFPVAVLCTCVAALILVVDQKAIGGSLTQRLGIWEVTLADLVPWGHGWGTFQHTFIMIPIKINMTGLIAPHAYNDYIELLSDLGLGVIPLTILVAFALLEGSGPRTIAICFLILGLTYFPLQIPIVAQVFALALGELIRSTRTQSLPAYSMSMR